MASTATTATARTREYHAITVSLTSSFLQGHVRPEPCPRRLKAAGTGQLAAAHGPGLSPLPVPLLHVSESSIRVTLLCSQEEEEQWQEQWAIAANRRGLLTTASPVVAQGQGGNIVSVTPDQVG